MLLSSLTLTRSCTEEFRKPCYQIAFKTLCAINILINKKNINFKTFD